MKTKRYSQSLLSLAGAAVVLCASALSAAQGAPAAPTGPAPAVTAPTDPAAAPAAPTGDPAAPTGDPAAPASDPAAATAPEPASASASMGLPSGPETTGADTASEPAPSGKDRGAFVAGGKFGGLLQLSGFGPNITGALEIGYILPFLKRGIGVMVDASYAAPVVSGIEQDPRVQGGSYEWSLVQKQLTVFPFVTYRYTGLGKIVPYVGVGPRIVMLEGVTYGTVAGKPLLENRERSTKVGVGVPLGAEYLIGPGAAMGEFLFAYNSIDHKSTGNASLTGFTLWLGYRFLL